MCWPRSTSKSPHTTPRCPCCSGNLKQPLQANQQLASVGVELGATVPARKKHTGPSAVTGATSARVEFMRREAVRMRRSRMTLEESVREMGVTKGGAWRLVQEASYTRGFFFVSNAPGSMP
jgi:hypothetical protein